MGWSFQSNIFKGPGWHGSLDPLSIRYVVFLLVFQLLNHPHPTLGAQLDISKREAQLIQIIEKHAMTLDFRKFDHDPVMIQSSTDSEYTKNRQSKDVLFYKRNPDSGKDAIALSSAENQFAIPTPRGNLKRQFILLKKSPLAVEDGSDSDVPYFGSFVYVRNLLANDDAKKSVFEVNGTKTVIEWDIWETRTRGFYAGWETCDFTNLFTCESFYEMISRADKQIEADGGVEKDKPKGTKKSRRRREAPAAAQPWPKLTPIVSEEGYDPADFNDLYLDLDLHREANMRHPMRRPQRKKKNGTQAPKRRRRAMDNVAELEMDDDSDQSLNRVKRFGGLADAAKGGMESASGGEAKKKKKKKGKGGAEAGAGASVGMEAAADLGGGMGGGAMANIKSSVKGYAKAPNLLKKLKDTPGGYAKASADVFASVDVNADVDVMAGGGLSAMIAGSLDGEIAGSASVAGYADMKSMGKGALAGLGIGAEVFGSVSAGLGTPLEALEASVGVSASASAGFGGMFEGGAEAAAGASAGASASASANVFASAGGRSFAGVGGQVNAAASVSTMVGGQNSLGAIVNVVGNANPLTAIAGGGTSVTAMASVGGGFGGNLQAIVNGNAQASVGGNAMMGALASIGGSLSTGKGGALSALLGGENSLVAVTQIAGSLGNINGLIGGALGDVAIGSVSGAVSGLLTGGCGPVGLLGNLMAGGLGAAASVRVLLGPAEAAMETVNGRVKELSVDISANIVGTLEISGEGGMTDCFGDVVSSILTCGGEATSPIAMAGKILGPISGALAPATAIVAAANGIVTGLPLMGAAMGQSIISSLPVDTLNVGGMLASLGLGPIVGSVTALADSIVAVGESLVSSVDMLGNGIIDGAAEVLVKMGVPKEIAQLAAMGAHLTFNTLYLVVKGHALGVRLSVDLAGAVLNGGASRGSGSGPSDGSFATWQKWVNNDGISSNAYLGFGFVYPGAAEGKSFFIPDYSLVRCAYKAEGTKVMGYFHPSTTTDGNSFFFADDPAKMQSLSGKVGVMTPTSYKQPHRDASYGIHGEVSVDGFFKSASNPKFGVFNPADVRNVSNFWMPPGMETKGPQRPSRTADGMPVIYGMLFPGMIESPHIFVAEGDMLTGFFVPYGNNPKMKETPHGVFIPGRAGHGKFSLEDSEEFKDAKEARGAFLPDAMNLEGGISGKIVRTDNSSTFNFIMDRPSVDYAYIKGHPSTAMIWATFLSAEEWKYTAPPVPPPENEDHPDKEKKEAKEPTKEKEPTTEAPARRKRAAANLEVSHNELFGIKVVTQKTTSFLPENYEIEGTIIIVDKQVKYKPMHGSIVAGRPNTPWKMKIIKREESDPKVEKPVICLFVPKGYAKDDAMIGVMILKEDQKEGEVQISEKQKQAEHFWTDEQELWVPPGFVEFAKTNKKPEVQEPKGEEAKKEQSTQVPGVKKQRSEAPFLAPNYYYGPLFQKGEEAEENILKDVPHQYHYGLYYVDGANFLFFPEQGGKCTFTPEGKSPEKCIFTPGSPKKPGSSKFDTEGAVADGTAGILKSVDVKGEESKEGIQATFNKGFEFNEGVEIMPGWSIAIVAAENNTDGDHKDLKYSMIDIGGGLKAVVVDGPAALEDANNPLFQKFLHYKAHTDGNVNPWGRVLIFDPIQRKGGGDGKLGVGTTKDAVLTAAPLLGGSLMANFKINNWAWPTARVNGVGGMDAKMKKGLRSLQPVTIGEKRNIVNMMDFRMWLLRRYRCKIAPGEGDKKITILTPRMAEGYIDVVNPSKYKQEYFDAIKKSDESVVMPYEEGMLGFFTKMFNLDNEDMQQYYGQKRRTTVSASGQAAVNRRRKRSPKKKEGGGGGDAGGGANEGKEPEYTKDAPFGEWGGAELCDEIDLPDFAVAQIEEEQGAGMDLGLALIEKEGAKMPWPAVASKLIGRVQKKRKKPPGQVLDNLGTTDLLGLNIQIVAGMVVQKKKTNTDSGEQTNEEKKSERRKRSSRRKRRRREAKKKDDDDDDDNPGENVPGWRTQYKPKPWKDKVTVSADGLIFYGLGNCRQEKIPDPKLLESKDATKIVEYYMKVLRIDCRPKRRPKMMDLFNDRLLVLSEDRKYFEIMKENELFHKQRLTPREIVKISLAFEMSAFTKSYHKLRTSGGFPTKGFLESEGTKISRTIGFFTEMTLYYVQRARRVSPPHSVRLTRNMLKTLRTVLTKMHQDVMLLEKHCAQDCPTDLEVTKNDKFTVMALVQFIIHGLGPVEKNTEDVRAAFDKFMDLNKKAIEERVEEFDRQYPVKPKKEE